MLKSVTLKNFKAHKDTTIEAQRINVFIGPNNSGKSSIFQALLALKQAARRGPSENRFFLPAVPRARTKEDPARFYLPNVLIDLGDFESLLSDKSRDLSLATSGVLPAREPYAFHDPIELQFEVQLRDNQIESHAGRLKFAETVIPWQFVKNLGGQEPPSVKIGRANFTLRPEDNFRLLAHGGLEFDPGPSPVSREEQDRISRFSDYLVSAPAHFLDSVHLIYRFAGLEEWGVPFPSQPPKDLEAVTLEERTIATTGLLAYDPDRVESLSQYLASLFGFVIKVKPLPGPRIVLRIRHAPGARNDTLLSNEGTGATQLPFILVPMMLAPEGDTVFVCEPEAHLHPKAQSEATSLIFEIAKRRNMQLFIETHSEHVLHKLLHAVAKGDLTKDDLAIYYFENLDGTSRVTRLSVDETGRVEGGLRGFFEQSVEELSDYLDALRKPQTREA